MCEISDHYMIILYDYSPLTVNLAFPKAVFLYMNFKRFTQKEDFGILLFSRQLLENFKSSGNEFLEF